MLREKWLKAGYVENHRFHATVDGTPPGGIISPAMANMTLDGPRKVLHIVEREGRKQQTLLPRAILRNKARQTGSQHERTGPKTEMRVKLEHRRNR